MTRWQASQAEVDGARSEKVDLGSQVARAKGELEKLKKESERPVVRFRFGDDLAGRKPVLIELAKDAVLVRSGGAPRPDEASVPSAEATARGGFFDKLAASLASPGTDRYAVLFVRPDAVDLYFAATEKLRRRRVPYAAEPVEQNWNLVFEGAGLAPN